MLRRLDIRYGVSFLFTPLFAIFYIAIFQQTYVNVHTILSDYWSLFFLVFFYPLFEELAFRGVIQEYISRKTNHYTLNSFLSIANIITSILFASIHFVHHHPIVAILTFFPSLLLGYFKEHYQHIMPSILLHMYYNIWSLLLVI